MVFGGDRDRGRETSPAASRRRSRRVKVAVRQLRARRRSRGCRCGCRCSRRTCRSGCRVTEPATSEVNFTPSSTPGVAGVAPAGGRVRAPDRARAADVARPVRRRASRGCRCRRRRARDRRAAGCRGRPSCRSSCVVPGRRVPGGATVGGDLDAGDDAAAGVGGGAGDVHVGAVATVAPARRRRRWPRSARSCRSTRVGRSEPCDAASTAVRPCRRTGSRWPVACCGRRRGTAGVVVEAPRPLHGAGPEHQRPARGPVERQVVRGGAAGLSGAAVVGEDSRSVDVVEDRSNSPAGGTRCRAPRPTRSPACPARAPA